MPFKFLSKEKEVSLDDITIVPLSLNKPRPAPAMQRPKWMPIYSLLASLVVITVLLSLFQSHEIIKTYSASSQVDEVLTRRLNQYANLRQLAAGVRFRAFEAFEPDDFDREAEELSNAVSEFNTALGAARSEVEYNQDAANRDLLLGQLDALGQKMNSAVYEANLTLSSFKDASAQNTRGRLVIMNRGFTEVSRLLSQLEKTQRDIQQERLTERESHIASLRTRELLIATCIVGLVGCALFYGRRLSRQLNKTGMDRERYISALRMSEDRFRSLSAASPIGIFQTDASGRCIYTNKRWQEITGLTLEESLGDGWVRALHPEDRQSVLDHWAKVAPQDGESALEFRMQRRGETRWVSSRTRALVYEDGQLLGHVGTSEDITDRKLTEKRLVIEHEVSRLLAQAESLTGVAPNMLQTICERLGWDAADIWIANNDETALEMVAIWHAPEMQMKEFETVSRKISIKQGEGLSGLVWETSKPVWISDVARESRFIRSRVAEMNGIHGGAGFPLTLGSKVIGLIHFFSREKRSGDETLADVMKRLSSEIGQFVARKRAEQIIRLSERRYRDLVENSQGMICTHDLDGILLSVNTAAASALGYEASELVGKSLKELIPRSKGAYFEGYLALIREEKTSSGLMTLLTKEGEKRVWMFRNSRHEEPGRPAYVLGHAVDITALKRTEAALQESEQRYRALAETATDAIVTIDSKGRITFINPAAEKIFGHPTTDMIGQSITLLMPEFMNQIQEAASRDQAEAGEKQLQRSSMEIPGLHKSGKKIHLEMSFAEQEIDGSPTITGIIRDITSRKMAAAELRKAKEAAEAATRAKSEFLANMSHEIRTPMNAVIGMTGLLLDTKLSGEQRDFVETIRSSSDGLLTIINDILDFSKIESGQLEMEVQPFDLRDCIEESLDLVAAKAAEKGLEMAYLISSDVPGMICGDVTRLRQVLVNLLSNAVKFTHQGEVVVSVSSRLLDQASQQTYELSFAVRDTGIGIPDDRLNRLFRSFSQVDASTTRQYGGTGLGLAISKRLAGLMGGRMWVESDVGIGSTFYFTITTQPSSGRMRIYLRGAQPQLEGKKALIVDDNETNRLILTQQARLWGMATQAIASGAEALEILKSGERFDVGILDMQMPEMDGVMLAKEILKQEGGQTLPLVMLSSLGRRAEDNKTVDSLFSVYLTKPIKPSQLFDALMEVFDRQHPGRIRVTPHEEKNDATEDTKSMAERLPLRILVAEDNAVNQKVALKILESLGYRADIAGNGLEVLEALERQPYDIILMDMQMPEMDGLEATRHICRRWPEPNRPRVIAMTANAMSEHNEQCMAAGMDDYISKPVRIAILKTALEKWGSKLSVQTEPTASTAGDEDSSIDFTVLDDIRRMDDEDGGSLTGELISLYLEDSLAQMKALKESISSQSAEEIKRMSHTLRGSSSYLGATRLAAQCARLEEAANEGKFDEAATMVNELEVEYKRVRVTLQEVLQNDGVRQVAD